MYDIFRDIFHISVTVLTIIYNFILNLLEDLCFLMYLTIFNIQYYHEYNIIGSTQGSIFYVKFPSQRNISTFRARFGLLESCILHQLEGKGHVVHLSETHGIGKCQSTTCWFSTL